MPGDHGSRQETDENEIAANPEGKPEVVPDTVGQRAVERTECEFAHEQDSVEEPHHSRREKLSDKVNELIWSEIDPGNIEH